MKFIHNRDKNSVSIFSVQKQLILKISGTPLLFCKQRNSYFFACGKETIRIDVCLHKNDSSSLDVFYNQKHILSFVPETPEIQSRLSVYDDLPPLLSIPKISEIQKNKWIFTDYREHLKMSLSPPERQMQKSKKNELSISMTDTKKARFREL